MDGGESKRKIVDKIIRLGVGEEKGRREDEKLNSSKQEDFNVAALSFSFSCLPVVLTAGSSWSLLLIT